MKDKKPKSERQKRLEARGWKIKKAGKMFEASKDNRTVAAESVHALYNRLVAEPNKKKTVSGHKKKPAIKKKKAAGRKKPARKKPLKQAELFQA